MRREFWHYILVVLLVQTIYCEFLHIKEYTHTTCNTYTYSQNYNKNQYLAYYTCNHYLYFKQVGGLHCAKFWIPVPKESPSEKPKRLSYIFTFFFILFYLFFACQENIMCIHLVKTMHGVCKVSDLLLLSSNLSRINCAGRVGGSSL